MVNGSLYKCAYYKVWIGHIDRADHHQVWTGTARQVVKMWNTSVLGEMPASQSPKCSWPGLKLLSPISRPPAFTRNLGFLPSIAEGLEDRVPPTKPAFTLNGP